MTMQRSGKANPDCVCLGTGVKIETICIPEQGAEGEVFETLKTRCPCTDMPDPTVEANDLETWEAE